MAAFVTGKKVADDDEEHNDTATSNADDANLNKSLPEIEVKMFGKTILLNVYCEKQKGILTTLLDDVEKRDMSVVNCSMITFDCFALDITIVAQVEKDFKQDVNDLIRELRSLF